jgi:pimeloyl-ACP methyl ester carboxylesterase
MTGPSQPNTVHVDDGDLAYVEQGQGEPVVFVHGSVGDYRSWGAQMGPFGERYRTVAYSRRYHWPNARPAEGTAYEIARHVADLAHLIEGLGSGPAHVVGSSYGAMTALTCAVERPDRFRSLVLSEPPLLPWLTRLPEGQAVFAEFVANAFGPAAQAFARSEEETGVRLFLDGVLGPGAFDRIPAPARAAMLDNAAAMRAETETAPERYFSPLSPEQASRLHVPTLVIEGERSPRMFGMISDELARVLPRAERATVLDASHGMHGSEPGGVQRDGAGVPAPAARRALRRRAWGRQRSICAGFFQWSTRRSTRKGGSTKGISSGSSST